MPSIQLYVISSCFKFVTFFLNYTMPKYAVAVGRKIGVYDTYDECKKQILNFPRAKFKKFQTVKEAEEFISKYSAGNVDKCITYGKALSPCGSGSTSSFPETLTVPSSTRKIEKVSPSDSVLHSISQRVSNMEDQLNKFISSTLQNVTERLEQFERNAVIRSDTCDAPPAKVPKLSFGSSIGNTDFQRNEKGVVKVFTDGACSKNGQKGAKAGIGVFFNHGHPLNVSAPVKGPPTNNNAEIQAARIAIIQAHQAGLRHLAVHTDSKFMISCISEWIHKWKTNNWQLSTGGPVKNKNELVKLDEAIQDMESVEWIYVTAHSGIEGNEIADRLAREGAARYCPEKTNGNSK